MGAIIKTLGAKQTTIINVNSIVEHVIENTAIVHWMVTIQPLMRDLWNCMATPGTSHISSHRAN